MAWVVHRVPGQPKDTAKKDIRYLRFASHRKLREYLLRLHKETLQDVHTVQLHHGCASVKHNGKTYTAGHKITTAEFRGF